MTETNEPLPGGPDGTEQLPQPGEPVWVECEGCRTMGYRDAKGVWRSLGNDMELKGIIEVVLPYRPWDVDF